jgi:hypothetical protein
VRTRLRHAATAARVAGERSDLWPAGALGSLAFLGWLPLLLTVARVDVGGLDLLASDLRKSSAYPANVVALGVTLVAGAMLLCLLAAMAEAALAGFASPRQRSHPAFAQASLGALSVILACALPAALALGAFLLGAVAVAPGEFLSPDLGVPLALRLARDLAPFLAALLVAVLLGQAIGGAALRRVLGPAATPVGAALAGATRELARRPVQRIGMAATGLLADLLSAALTYAVLRVLWAPIAVDLGAGRLARPDTLLLLVGFVAIWLVLLLAAGALHVMISTWWALELADVEVASRDVAVAGRPDARGGPTDDAQPLP